VRKSYFGGGARAPAAPLGAALVWPIAPPGQGVGSPGRDKNTLPCAYTSFTEHKKGRTHVISGPLKEVNSPSEWAVTRSTLPPLRSGMPDEKQDANGGDEEQPRHHRLKQ
jgi:hypothetical protein